MLTLKEIYPSGFNGFSVQWCHIPSISAFKVCLLHVYFLSFSASLQFRCHFWGLCVDGDSLSREQETRSLIVRLTTVQQQLWSADAGVRRNSCSSLFSVFRGLDSLSLLYDHFPRLVTWVRYQDSVLNWATFRFIKSRDYYVSVYLAGKHVSMHLCLEFSGRSIVLDCG